MTAASPAGLILRNGRIYTVDAMRSWASAVAIDKGQFVAIGDDAAVGALKGPFTSMVDLKGRMAMPGIVDIGAQVLADGQAEFDLGIASDCGDGFRAEAAGWAEAPPSDWITAAQRSDRPPSLTLDAAPFVSVHYRPETRQAAAASMIQTLNSFGVTAFLEGASTREIMGALKSLDDRGALTAWAGCTIPADESSRTLRQSGDPLVVTREMYRSRHVKPDFVSVSLDTPACRTPTFHEPYLADPIRGSSLRASTASTSDLIRCLINCETMGLSVKIHCAGDTAVTEALDAIEVVRNFNGQTFLTHRIAHAGYIAPEDIHRFGELSVVADASPGRRYPTFFLDDDKIAVGAAQAGRFWHNRDLLLSGALLTCGSDWAAALNPGPWSGMEALITGRNLSGEFGDTTLWPEQTLDLESAIEIHTINGAQAMQLDAITGSIEIGKSADLIVLDRNLFETSADRIADTKVLSTYFEGRLVYERA